MSRYPDVSPVLDVRMSLVKHHDTGLAIRRGKVGQVKGKRSPTLCRGDTNSPRYDSAQPKRRRLRILRPGLGAGKESYRQTGKEIKPAFRPRQSENSPPMRLY